MTEKFKLSLGRLWLFVASISLLLPVFLPSSANPQNFLQNVIGSTMVTMFILSFPSSLFGIPLFFVASAALGVDPNTIQGMYLNLFLMFVLGLVQWFWIVPRILRKNTDLEILNLATQEPISLLPQANVGTDHEFFDARSRTPLERVIRDDEGE